MLNESPLNSNQQKPRFLWWRFAALTIALMVAAYCFYWCYERTPTRAQQLVFDLILAAIVIQTVQAGWYRKQDPWEATAFRALAAFFIVLLVFAGVMIMVVLLVSAASEFLDPVPAFLGVILIVVIVVAVLAYVFDRDR